MNKLDRRLTALERVVTPVEGAWLAIQNNDNGYSLSHQKHGHVELLNQNALNEFIENNRLNTGDRVKIIITDNPQGEPPFEL